MAKLVGSEKQVKWAEEIREKKIAEFRNWVIESAKQHGASEEQKDALLDVVTNLALGQTHAVWWIDIRNMNNIEAVIDKLDVDAMMGTGRDKGLGERTIF